MFLKSTNRIRKIQIFFIFILFILSIRLFMLQVYPSAEVVSQYRNHQSEIITDCKYSVLDTNYKDLIRYNKKYILVIDKEPFSLNNYEKNLEDLMAFNFIMKEEVSEFNYTSIMKSTGKTYYQISEDTFNKIGKLNNIKGIYTYIKDDVDIKYAWNIGTFFASLDKNKDVVEDSLEGTISSYVNNNVYQMKNFYLDNKEMYSSYKLKNNDNRHLKLTIDKEYNDIINNVLQKECFSKLDNIGVILMESNTGKIRAMTEKDESQAEINLGMEGSGYEPGSIYKLITLSSALEEGLITMQDPFYCSGEICHTVHGMLTVENALKLSCNDCFAKMGNKLGYEKMISYSEKLGLFNRVLNLKGETKGIKPEISKGMNNISIGQCLTVSPVQMIGAVNAIVNDGLYVKPYILEEIIDNEDKPINKFEVTPTRVFSETTSALTKNAMIKVVNSGTGVNAKVEGITIGGKTGSATSGNDKGTHGWFVGYFDYNDITYTMIVFVPNIQDNGQDGEELGGGNTAAPIFSQIVQQIINKN